MNGLSIKTHNNSIFISFLNFKLIHSSMRWDAHGHNHDWTRNSILVTCLFLLCAPIESYDMDDYDVLVKRPQRL